jgi:tyrosine-protein kinase Etk/Wzc
MSNNNISSSVVMDSARLSAKEMFFKYLVYLPLFIISIGVFITIAYIYIRYKVPIYNSSISIMIKDSRSGSSGDNMLLDDVMFYNKRANLANEIEFLRSGSMMERVVKSLKLNIQYASEGKVKKSEVYNNPDLQMILMSIKDSSQSFTITLIPSKNDIIARFGGKEFPVQTGDVISNSNATVKLLFKRASLSTEYKYHISYRPVWSVAASIAGSLSARQLSREATVLVLSINTEIPDKGRDILNQLAEEYREMNIEDKNKVVENTIKFIDDRLYLLTQELGDVEGNLQTFRQNSNVIDVEKQSSAEFSELKELEKKVDEQDIEFEIMGMIRNYISNPARKFELVPSSLGIKDVTLNSLIGNYNQLQLSRAEQLKTIPAEHPSMKVLESQVEKLRTSILENLSNILVPQRALAAKLKRDYQSALQRVQAIPGKQKALLEIQRQQGIKEKLYLFLLQKKEEAAITRASATGNSSALDPATSSWAPVSPNSSNIYRLAFLVGILLPVALIYLKDLLNDKVIVRTDLTKNTATPIIGEIAHHAAMARKFVVGMKDRSILAEQFRIIRTNLQFLLAHAPAKNPVILVTSSIAGEGKTFTSMNMAAVWAVAGKKTVIMELDLRKPKVSKALGLQRDIGITNYILGNSKKEDLPQPLEEVPNLYVIGAGPIPPNPSEMIMDSRMDELFAYLRANFDIIIIDSAPIGLVSDSKILARFADATLYVIRQRYTVKKQIGLVDDLYTQKILPNMGLIVNDVRIGGANSYYGYGYGYGYGYSYNYNYTYSYGEEQKKTFLQRIKDMVGL